MDGGVPWSPWRGGPASANHIPPPGGFWGDALSSAGGRHSPLLGESSTHAMAAHTSLRLCDAFAAHFSSEFAATTRTLQLLVGFQDSIHVLALPHDLWMCLAFAEEVLTRVEKASIALRARLRADAAPLLPILCQALCVLLKWGCDHRDIASLMPTSAVVVKVSGVIPYLPAPHCITRSSSDAVHR